MPLPAVPALQADLRLRKKFLRLVAHVQNDKIKINFDTCAGGVCKKEAAGLQEEAC